MNNREKEVTMLQHPDALYDQPYEDEILYTERYKSLAGKLDVSWTESGGRVVIKDGDSMHMTVEAYADCILRLRICPGSAQKTVTITEQLGLLKLDEPISEFKYEVAEHTILITAPKLKMVIDRSEKDISVLDCDGNCILQSQEGGFRFSEEEPEYGGARYLASFRIGDERFFGFGGRIMHPDRTGTSVDIFSEKVGKRSGDYGGCPIPFFMSTRGYGIFLNNPWPHVYFDMGKTDPDKWFVHAPGGDCDLFIIYGPEFPGILRHFTGMAGRIPVIPRWMLGYWCSSLSFEKAGNVVDMAARLRQEEYPCDVMVLDGPWRGGPDFIRRYLETGDYPSNDLSWHPDFGDGVEMIEQLDDRGFKTCLHLNSRNFKPSTAERAVKAGLLRRQGEEVVARLTYPEAEEYYSGLLKPRIREGVDVWWTDHADRVSGEIREGIPSRNLFGPLWNRLLCEKMKENSGRNTLCLARGSGIGGQRYALPWPGDTRVGIDYFEEDIWFCLNAGLAGFPITSADMGGFSSTGDESAQTKDMLYSEAFSADNIQRRFCQSIFFIPAPRMHDNGTTLPRFPWNCLEEARPLYKEMLMLRYSYTPYIYSCAILASKTGEPILRPLVYHHRMDTECYAIGDEFYMGDWLLIAPITEAKASKRRVYLPSGNWIHLWSEIRYEGPCWVDIEAPCCDVSGLPLFIKAGAILPKQKSELYLKEEIPCELELDIYPEASSSYILYESEEVSNRFTCEKDGDSITLHLENNTSAPRKYNITIHDTAEDTDVTVNGKKVPDTMYLHEMKQTVFRSNLINE